MTTKERGIYQGISLPLSLIQETKKHIEKRPQYKGVTEFIRTAIREKMDREKHPFLPNDPKTNEILTALTLAMDRIEKKIK